MNVVMNLQVSENAGNVACFLSGRVKDLSAPLYHSFRCLQLEGNQSNFVSLCHHCIFSHPDYSCGMF